MSEKLADQDQAGALPGENPLPRELRELLTLALPLVGAQLAFVGINTTDVLVIGWLGPGELAAAALAHNLYFPIWLFCMGVLTAVAPIAAQARGARQPRMVRRSARQGFWTALCLGLPSWALLANTESLLLFFGQSAENAALAHEYAIPYLFGWLPSLGFIVLRVFLTTMDLARVAFYVMLGGLFANAFLTYGLTFGAFHLPRLGLVGAGLASAIVNSVMFLVLALYAARARRIRRYGLFNRFWRPDWQVFREIFAIGLPIGLTIVMESSLFGAAGLMMGRIGTAEIAAHTIALQCAAIAFMIPLGVGQASTVRVGIAVGRGDFPSIGYIGWLAVALAILLAVTSMTLFLSFPVTIFDVFLDFSDPETARVVMLGTGYLAIAGLFQVFDATQVTSVSILRGMKDTRVPMFMAGFGYWGVGFPVAWLLAFEFGLEGEGIWIGLAAGLAVAAGLLTLRFARRRALGLVRA